MTPEQRIAQMEAEVERLRGVLADVSTICEDKSLRSGFKYPGEVERQQREIIERVWRIARDAYGRGVR